MKFCQTDAAFGIAEPEILLPAAGIDLYKWAVVACDQFTQDRAYWDKCAQISNGSPSALNLIFPECFLEDNGKQERIEKIHAAMKSYLEQSVFAPPKKGFLYIERETSGVLRPGLLAAVDLECYDWKKDSSPLVRATEGTIEARLPPRMDIRRGAALELPHIMLLINDEDDSLFKRLAVGSEPFIYDTALMQNGGRVRGRFVKDKTVFDELQNISEKTSSEKDGGPFMFAVGDGNHSLAAAKAIWNEFKAEKGLGADSPHPLRYALVEIVNIYSKALAFEPIHRVILGEKTGLPPLSGLFKTHSIETREKLKALTAQSGGLRFGIIQGKNYILAESDSNLLATAVIEPLLVKFCAENPRLTLDYIHGENELFALCEKEGANAAGFLLPPFAKDGLFKTIAKTGTLPRKSFSMGQACDKRYYLEARKL